MLCSSGYSDTKVASPNVSCVAVRLAGTEPEMESGLSSCYQKAVLCARLALFAESTFGIDRLELRAFTTVLAVLLVITRKLSRLEPKYEPEVAGYMKSRRFLTVSVILVRLSFLPFHKSAVQ